MGNESTGVHSVMMLLYSMGLTLALVVSSPWWLLRMATTQRYREGLRQRLGAVPAELRQVVQGKRVVWLHAVSVGEVLAATRLVADLEAALGEGWIVVVSTTTRTGQELARQRFGAARVFYVPLDFAFAVRTYVDALYPAALVLMESELWPRMLDECLQRKIPVAVANARVSDRSFRRGLKLRAAWSRALRKVTLWLPQTEEDGRRLVAMGARAEAIQVVGNLKYDVRAPKESRVAELIRQAAGARRILVAGSTLDGDPPEDSPLIWLQQAIEPAERPLLVLAPRHPDNFDVLYSMAIEFPTLRATELLVGKKASDGHAVSHREGETATVEIVVLDTIGDLAAVYGVADVAFVGGSLTRRGGHNPLEPAQFGVPVVMGPSFENFRDIVNKMQAVDGIAIGRDVDDVRSLITHLLLDPLAARALGERGRQVFLSQQGATARSVAAILKLVTP